MQIALNFPDSMIQAMMKITDNNDLAIMEQLISSKVQGIIWNEINSNYGNVVTKSEFKNALNSILQSNDNLEINELDCL